MKITKFAQSCILIETNNKKILIDPGCLQFKESLLQNQWANIDILLITHKHGDHYLYEAVQEIVKNPKTKFYTSQEVANSHPELSPKIIKEGDILHLNDITIEIVKAVHGYMPFLTENNAIKENIGYIINDGNKKAYHTSDTISFKNNYKCDIIFVPISNHGLVMGTYEASLFAKETEAKLIIPIHFDNPKYPTNLNNAKEEFEKEKLNFKILKIGESITF
ncbi:MAG: MBL fold metallo-hydrolase [Candidatus Pacebacteria bacterium]|nr:MBL fold metallo-hydrolase [Candidatus Paceibacterota bacterium]